MKNFSQTVLALVAALQLASATNGQSTTPFKEANVHDEFLGIKNASKCQLNDDAEAMLADLVESHVQDRKLEPKFIPDDLKDAFGKPAVVGGEEYKDVWWISVPLTGNWYGLAISQITRGPPHDWGRTLGIYVAGTPEDVANALNEIGMDFQLDSEARSARSSTGWFTTYDMEENGISKILCTY